MGAVSDDFYVAVMAGIGAPWDEANRFTCHAWQTMEGGSARENPWNTTQPANGATSYNSVGVRNYPSEHAGVQATIETLHNPHGYYARIVAGFKASDPLATAEAIDASKWGTHGVADYVRHHWHGPTGADDMPLTHADADLVVDRLLARELPGVPDDPSRPNKPRTVGDMLRQIEFQVDKIAAQSYQDVKLDQAQAAHDAKDHV